VKGFYAQIGQSGGLNCRQKVPVLRPELLVKTDPVLLKEAAVAPGLQLPFDELHHFHFVKGLFVLKSGPGFGYFMVYLIHRN
jgi:hypothetical protein